jgi:hypothetical protein
MEEEEFYNIFDLMEEEEEFYNHLIRRNGMFELRKLFVIIRI